MNRTMLLNILLLICGYLTLGVVEEGGVMGDFNTSATYSWTASKAPTTNWFSIATSRTGQISIASSMVIGENMTGIYLSKDFGQTWTNIFISGAGYGLQWNGVAINLDGTTMFALQQETGLYYSHDGGRSWSRTIIDSALIHAQWNSVSCSSDGQYVVATCTGCYIYYSSNVGYSFKRSNFADASFFVSMSPSGKYVVAGSQSLYYSNNYGATFTKTSAPTLSWYGVDFSSGVDAIAVAVAEGNTQSSGGIYLSTTSGQSWVVSSASRSLPWKGCAVDGSGKIIIATASSSGIYMSTDGGKIFTSTVSPTGTFRGVACDFNATRPIAMTTGSSSGKIYYGTKV